MNKCVICEFLKIIWKNVKAIIVTCTVATVLFAIALGFELLFEYLDENDLLGILCLIVLMILGMFIVSSAIKGLVNAWRTAKRKCK